MLDLKYRPKRFSDIVGNDSVKRILINKSLKGVLSNRSYLLSGQKGSGKTTTARLIAKAISCSSLVDGEPCNKCEFCIDIQNESSYFVDEMDSAVSGNSESVRKIVTDSEFSTVGSTGKRIVIFDEAHNLSKSSQDVLLKALEERSFIAILCTTEPNKIRDAIRDRTEEYFFSYPSNDEIFLLLKRVCIDESIQHDDNAIRSLIQSYSASPRSYLLAIEAMSHEGGVNSGTICRYTKDDSFTHLNGCFLASKTNVNTAFSILDSIFRREDVSVIRHIASSLFSDARRSFLKIKPKRELDYSWYSKPDIEFLFDLILRPEKVNKHDFEMLILNMSGTPGVIDKRVTIDVPSLDRKPQIATVNSEVLTPNQVFPDKPKSPAVTNLPAKEIPPNSDQFKSIKIDGVKFDSNETLTSLDHKVKRKDSNSVPKSSGNETTSPVLGKYSDVKVPISVSEFRNGILKRHKN